jgi:hypothetical protein
MLALYEDHPIEYMKGILTQNPEGYNIISTKSSDFFKRKYTFIGLIGHECLRHLYG